ncbi:MAG TPA: hypothetical protein VK862_14365 [Afifellaceae bacterium]|nr:hypothetical protein [Afifellaceae bacterium]
MKSILAVTLVAVIIAGCAASRPVTTYSVNEGPYLRDAAVIEHGLEKQNRSDYDCQVQDDTLIVCDGVRNQIQ